MRTYNPQNQFGQDLITKALVKSITGLDTAPEKDLQTQISAKVASVANATASAISIDNTIATAPVISLKLDGDTLSQTASGLKVNITDSTSTTSSVTAASATAVKTVSDALDNEKDASKEGSLAYKIAALTSDYLTYQFVDELPATGDAKKNVIYLVGTPETSGTSNVLTEYIAVGSGTPWACTGYEKIGEMGFNASDYYKKSEVDDKVAAVLQDVNTVSNPGSNGITLSASKDSSNKLTVGLTVTPATQATDEFKTLSTTNFTTGAQVEARVGTAISEASASGAAAAKDYTDGLLGTGFSTTSTVTSQLSAVKSTADSAVQSVTGDTSKAVTVSFTKTGTAVTTTVGVSTAETTGTGTAIKLVTTDTNALATAANIQAAIDAAESRAKTTGSYTAGTGISISDNEISVKTDDLTGTVTDGATGWATGGAVYTAISTAKSDLTGDTTLKTETTKTITNAILLAQEAQCAADHAKADTLALYSQTMYAIGSTIELGVTAVSGSDGTFALANVPENVTVRILNTYVGDEEFMALADNTNNRVTLWTGDYVTVDGVTKPTADTIKVVCRVTGNPTHTH